MSKHQFFKLVLLIVSTNFIAQISYYIHQYYLANKRAPSVAGAALMLIVLGWFSISYVALRWGKTWGYWLLLAFLSVEFLFYIQTQIVQAASGKGILLHVVRFDGLVLFAVFAIGYINCIAAGYFIWYMVRRRHDLLTK